MPIGLRGLAHPRLLELVVDDELELRFGVETPRAGPVGGDVASLHQLGGRGLGVLGQPGADLQASRVVVGGEIDVHAESQPGAEAATLVRASSRTGTNTDGRVTQPVWSMSASWTDG